MFPQAIDAAARALIEEARAAGLTVTTAESCTGGLVAAAICSISGASDVFDRGVVTYSNAAKAAMIGVPEALLAAHGAVSEPVARAMAEGALAASGADVAVAITGIAGPGGGSPAKPVGTVHFAAARDGFTLHRHEVFAGLDRGGVQFAAVETALEMLRNLVRA
ncbi:MAG: damage-inducible protein CinA [Caulobacterales bacterium 68-7]|nr:CinA family protein [Caulobacterales bacterium]OJU12863.1 MAG: damage-inducible protein CinA [Caulobacterales bacterium 68-7]